MKRTPVAGFISSATNRPSTALPLCIVGVLTSLSTSAFASPTSARIVSGLTYQFNMGASVGAGPIADAFDWSFDLRPTVGVNLYSTFYVESGVELGVLSVPNARPLDSSTCVNSGGGDACSGDKEKGVWFGVPLGVAIPISWSADRALRPAVGALYGFYSGDLAVPSDLRTGFGAYARLSFDVVSHCGGELSLQIVRSHGDQMENRIASPSSWDAWVGLSAFIRLDTSQ